MSLISVTTTRCKFCEGNLQEATVNFCVPSGERFILIESVPAMICDLCGEQAVTSEVVMFCEKTRKGLISKSRTDQMDVYTYERT